MPHPRWIRQYKQEHTVMVRARAREESREGLGQDNHACHVQVVDLDHGVHDCEEVGIVDKREDRKGSKV